MLWRNVRRGSRETQVLGSPRMPNAKVGHLPAMQGTAQEGMLWMDEHPSAIPTLLRLFNE
jgi:hypothetical protein